VAGQVRVGEWVRCCVGGRSDALLVIIDDALLSPLLHACSRAALPTAQCIVQPTRERAAGLSAPAADCDRLPARVEVRVGDTSGVMDSSVHGQFITPVSVCLASCR